MLYLELFNAISSISLKVMKSIVIFGGSGFVGKYLIRRLCKRGFRIIVPYQQSTNEAKHSEQAMEMGVCDTLLFSLTGASNSSESPLASAASGALC